jgi:RNA polymerase sigma-70 factor (ECF subfamily)
MSVPTSFAELMRRVRAGDAEAARELVKTYEAAIRRVIRFRAGNTGLRKLIDSMDICQSVLGSFFLRAFAGEYHIDSPEQLIKLLAQIARNKVAGHARKELAQRRDQRRQVSADVTLAPAGDASPSQIVMTRELVEEAQRRLTPEEQRLIEMRREGRDWPEIAAALNVNPAALRKRFSRTMARLARQLGLEEDAEE